MLGNFITITTQLPQAPWNKKWLRQLELDEATRGYFQFPLLASLFWTDETDYFIIENWH